MEHLVIGRVGIAVQNEAGRNEDVYQIDGAWQGTDETRKLLDNHIEDPERFVVNQEGQTVNVYTKQPDAAVQLAVYLNRQEGVHVSDADVEQVRKRLIRMQQGTEEAADTDRLH